MNFTLKFFKNLFAIAIFTAVVACSDNATTGGSGIDNSGASSIVSKTSASILEVESYAPLASNASSHFSEVNRNNTVSVVTPKVIDLGAPNQQTLKSNATTSTSVLGKPLKTGFARDSEQTASFNKTNTVWSWIKTSTGTQLAAIQFVSTTAAGLRVGLFIDSLPDGAKLRFYNPDSTKMIEVTGVHITETVKKNKVAGDLTDAGKTYWSPVVEGERIQIEIELPMGTDADVVQLAIPKVLHLFRDISGKLTGLGNIKSVGDADTCHVDAVCQNASNQDVRKSVAKVSFVSGGYAYTCSGTLLNDTLNSAIPYFITANHCVSNQTEASTVNTFWKFESSACNSGTLNVGYSILTGGATYLYGSSFTSGSDTAFMQLAGTPPQGVVYQGWSATKPDLNISAYSLHHPQGDLLKYTTGSMNNYMTVVDAGGGYFYTNVSSNGYTSNYLNLSSTSGTTEDGSSGGALITAGTLGSGKFIGQLLGGSASCSNPTGTTVFGRFDVAYNDALSTWLSPGKKPVFRFYNGMSGTHFYSNNPTESNYLKATFPFFSYEGVGFNAGTTSANGLSPVYRFYNLSLGNHFYTISASERDFVKAYLPQMRDEGIAWYAKATATSGMIPLYRFYNRDKGVHFYSVSATERAWVLANLPQMNDEGIAYYVWQ